MNNWIPLSDNQIDSIINVIALTPTCNATAKTVGDVIHLGATPKNGTAPYIITFAKGSTVIKTISNVAENTNVTYDYTTVAGDIGTIDFITSISDSCVAGAKTNSEKCTVTISAAGGGCNTPSVNMTLS